MEAYEAFAAVVQQVGLPLTITVEKGGTTRYHIDFDCNRCGVRLYRNVYLTVCRKVDIAHWLTYNGADLVNCCRTHECTNDIARQMGTKWSDAVNTLVATLRR